MKPHWGADLTGRPAQVSEPVAASGAKQVWGAGIRRLYSGFARRWRAGPSVRSLAASPGRWLVLALGVVLTYEFLLTSVIHDARQRDLAADFARPASEVQRGEAIAVIQIEKIQLNQVVVEGDSAAQLRAGPAHRMGTPQPGEPGNSLILGRRARYGGPFASLDRLSRGDRVTVKPRNGPAVAYEITRRRRTRSIVLSPSPTDARRLTLVTATPGLVGSDFLVVEAAAGTPEGDASRSTPRMVASRAVSAALLAPAFGWLAALLALAAAGRALRLRYPRPAALALQLPPTAFCLVRLLMSLDAVTGLA